MTSSIGGPERQSDLPAHRYLRPVLFAAAVAATAVAIFLLLWYAGRIVLFSYLGVLLGVFLHKTAQRLSAASRMPEKVALGIVITLLLGLLVFFIWLFGPHLIAQLGQLRLKLPEALGQVQRYILQFSWGKELLDLIPSLGQVLAGQVKSVPDYLSNAAYLGFAVLLILFVGIYLAVSPSYNLEGVISLAPPARRPYLRSVLADLGDTLQWWLIGRLLDMILVGSVTGLGLWLLEVPLSLTLAVLAGVLVFIPVIGPFISAVPAVLIAFANDPMQAVWVALLYAGIQQVESYLILPPIQRRMISVPPVLTIIMQAVLYNLAGMIGLLVAAPLTAAARLLVQRLFIHDYLEAGADQDQR